MSAIEFTVELKDNTIEIPKEHQGRLHGVVHVTIRVEKDVNQLDTIEQLLEQPLQIANFTPLKRNDANARP